MKRWYRVAGAVLVVSAAGCASALDSAMDAAGAGIGTAVGNRIGAAAGNALAARLPAAWSPDLTPLYMNYMFSMAFHSGSYTLPGTEYEPGEWTRWVLSGSEDAGEPTYMERAFLHRTGEGHEWWRVKYISDTGEGRDSITVEGLLDPESGEFRRMRGKMPGESEAREMPVEEGTYGYSQPRTLTAESMEGARVGSETVRVPAGTYTAEHLRYGTGYGALDWWYVDDVPGGLVKYSQSHENADTDDGELDPNHWTVELTASGTGATSQLGVDF